MTASTDTQKLDEALTGSRYDGKPLTQAERRALEAMVSASKLKDPYSRACRASKETSTAFPWRHVVNSRTAYGLERRGLASSYVRPRYGSDNHGHWGGHDTWYIITPGGRAALDATR
jgi:hypothetical protein